MSPFEIALLGVVSLLAAVALISLRFPRGRADWPLDARQTVWLLVSGLTAVLVAALLYIATRDAQWPTLVIATFAGVSLVLAILLATAVFLPQGLRSRP